MRVKPHLLPMRWTVLSGILLLALLAYPELPTSPGVGGSAWGQAEVLLTRILDDNKLWGEDAFAVFGTL